MELVIGSSIISLFFILFAIPFRRYLKSFLIYMIIPVNIVADTLNQFFGEQSTIQASLFRAPIIALIILFLIREIKVDRITNTILLFLVYLGILIFFSSNLALSLNTYVKLVMSLMMIPLGMAIIRNEGSLRKLHISSLASVSLLVINTIMAQYFQWGELAYDLGFIFLGGMGIYITYIFAYTLIMSPLANHFFERKGWLWVLYLISLIIILFVFRRGSIAALIAGYFTLLVNSRWAYKTRLILSAMVILILLVVLLPLYRDAIIPLFESRILNGFEVELYSRAGRIAETQVVWTEFLGKSIKHSLFGTELFNSGEVFYDWDRDGRPIHIDFNNFFYGSGIIGLGLFLLVYFNVTRQFLSAQKKMPSTDFHYRLKQVYWAIMIASIVLSLSNQYWNLTVYSFFWLHIGAILGVADVEKRKRIS